MSKTQYLFLFWVSCFLMNEQEPLAPRADAVQSSGDTAGEFGSRLEGSTWFTPARATWKPTSAACGFTGLLWSPQKAVFSTGTFAPSSGGSTSYTAAREKSCRTRFPLPHGVEVDAATSGSALQHHLSSSGPRSQLAHLLFYFLRAGVCLCASRWSLRRQDPQSAKGIAHVWRGPGTMLGEGGASCCGPTCWEPPRSETFYFPTHVILSTFRVTTSSMGLLTALSRITSGTAEPESEHSTNTSELSQYETRSPALTWGSIST